MPAENNNTCVLYKVIYDGVEHIILGTAHTPNRDISLLSAYEHIALAIPKYVRVGRVYFELGPEYMEHALYSNAKNGLDCKLYEEYKKIPTVSFYGLEKKLSDEEIYKTQQGIEQYFRFSIWSVIPTLLVLFITLSLKLSLLWVVLLAAFSVLLTVILQPKIETIYLLYRAKVIQRAITNSFKYFTNQKAKLLPLIITKYNFESAEAIATMNDRNRVFAEAVKAEKSPSLFAYGFMHNLSCKEVKSVIDLLKESGAEITGYETIKEMERGFAR